MAAQTSLNKHPEKILQLQINKCNIRTGGIYGSISLYPDVFDGTESDVIFGIYSHGVGFNSFGLNYQIKKAFDSAESESMSWWGNSIKAKEGFIEALSKFSSKRESPATISCCFPAARIRFPRWKDNNDEQSESMVKNSRLPPVYEKNSSNQNP
ncbi:hypothetical protein DdX_17534 [Ditylenchus destructor]|uniref:Uncharacterized protein n=1 Tax=Ditylenchus destructor TaxID=166010 RepID=A0AAD4MRS6_9BILA|nr:hypothetical protein DdX_17534 [Ditylenchus destructor]